MTDTLRHDWTLEEIQDLLALPFNDLLFKAAQTHRAHFDPNKVQISTLLSIKTGACPEDCKYCPQSAHYNTGLKKEPLMELEKVKQEARKAKEAGATRFCMGAAWRSLHDRDIPAVTEMVKEVKKLGLESCVTLGMAKENQLATLKEAGLDYYNHNIDSSPEFYEEVISTRKFQDRIDTLDAIQNAGLKTCSGGIIGMGETLEDRAKMLLTLANRNPQPESVPINLLIRIPGTPLEAQGTVPPLDFVRTIAVARLVMPKSYVRLSAGREAMSDELQSLCFFAGANSIFYGETLLTADNPETEKDNKLFNTLGIKAEEKPHDQKLA